MPCPSCGFGNPVGFRFCGECGAPLASDAGPRAYTPRHLVERVLTSRAALEGERKQVTVLFADVKGSLRLAELAGPEAWHRILDGFFRILTDGVHRFEGTVNQYTGDGMMALFGAPLAREDHAQRACHSALGIARELEPFGEELSRRQGLEFRVRMGLNSGEVVVGRIGDDLRMDYTAQGQVVGLASRMEKLAEPGRIYLTDRVERLVRGFFELKPLGLREAAGPAGRCRLRAGRRRGRAHAARRAGRRDPGATGGSRERAGCPRDGPRRGARLARPHPGPRGRGGRRQESALPRLRVALPSFRSRSDRDPLSGARPGAAPLRASPAPALLVRPGGPRGAGGGAGEGATRWPAAPCCSS